MIASMDEKSNAQDACQRQMETAMFVTGRLAHDFGNLLTGILGFAELSLTQLVQQSPARRYVEEIVHSAQNGAQWIRKLQAFSRKTPPRAVPTNLAPLVAREEERRHQAWGNRVTFLTALPEALPAVAVDAGSMCQLLGQLLDNAGEAVAERGVVTLSARSVELSRAACLDLVGNAQAGKYVEVIITDSGTGLSADTRQRLFRELFFSTKARRRGLGLALVQRILQTFKGGLCFDPDPAHGTCVRLFLPVATEPKPDSPAPPTPAPLAGEHVLVVDDDPVVLRMACQVLANAGFQVRGVTGPHEAIDLCHAQAEPFGLIVSDIVMPSMSGFEMIRHLQAQDFAVNVLFISSQPCNGLATDTLLNQYPLLRKPFEAHELVQAAGAALARAPAPCGGQPLTPVFDPKEVIP